MLNNLRIRSLIYAVLGAAQVAVFASASVVDPGVYVIRNVAFPNKVLDENKAHATGGWVLNGGANQKWLLIPLPDYGTIFTIQNCASKRYLHNSGQSVTTVPTSGTPYWSISDLEEAVKEFFVVSMDNPVNRGLTMTGGTSITAEEESGDTNQRWRFQNVGNSCPP
ncbi:hypothetical protein KI688_003202 [Linnemannia hyalina]|uniref:Ricin B lectin domain-containing protein n=1 Tax=Linnemannia hyalina TaxID=64524 RepID=A0A9P7XPF9_9FUNG|nr:hypothetical protein KI688_003202 [Linnemannia hyalina]